MSAYYRSGQAARVWAISPHLVRRLCAAGLIKAERTDSGQWRIPCAEVERIRQEGVPEIPSSIAEHDYHSKKVGVATPPGNSHGAPRSARSVTRLEELQAANGVRSALRMENESIGPRPPRNIQRVASRQVQMSDAPLVRTTHLQAEKERIAWHDSWMDTALRSLPREAPAEILLAVRETLADVLINFGPEHSSSVVEPLVNAAVAKVLRPWNQKRETARAVELVCNHLPEGAKNFFSPTIWQSRASEAAAAAIGKLPADATFFEKLRAGSSAVEQVTSDFRDSELRKMILQTAQLADIAPEERENATEAIRKKLESLPTGTDAFALQKAREQALAPFLEARKRRERVDQALRHIRTYLERLYREGEVDFESDWEVANFAKTLENKLRRAVERELLDNDLSHDELTDLIEDLVEEELD